jgi:hypothetical protein
MTIRFPYVPIPTRQPVISLNGRQERPRPMIPFSLVGPLNTVARDGLLDTGADDTVFDESLAMHIGIDLTNAPTGQAAGVGGSPVTLRYAQVTLRVSDGKEHRSWQAWVGFAPAGFGRPLLGYAGFLQFFDAHFRGRREEVELTVNDLYPGT